jgi:hypothetical protein
MPWFTAGYLNVKWQEKFSLTQYYPNLIQKSLSQLVQVKHETNRVTLYIKSAFIPADVIML